MNATKTEMLKLEYQLPASFHSQFGAWQSDERNSFPADRAHQDRKNHSEFAAKFATGLITRRAK